MCINPVLHCGTNKRGNSILVFNMFAGNLHIDYQSTFRHVMNGESEHGCCRMAPWRFSNTTSEKTLIHGKITHYHPINHPIRPRVLTDL